MKYSIRGRLVMSDGEPVTETINKHMLWRLITENSKDEVTGEHLFHFEVWVNTVEEKDNLFDSLKVFVDEYGELIDWHKCHHDELDYNQPCIIEEEYAGG